MWPSDRAIAANRAARIRIAANKIVVCAPGLRGTIMLNRAGTAGFEAFVSADQSLEFQRRSWEDKYVTDFRGRLPTDRILRFAVVVIAACFIAADAQPDPPTAEMKADVARLVAHANKLKRLWPWEPPLSDVARVARHGKTVAPLLVDLIGDDPDLPESDRPEWTVQQQAALTLCRIYGVKDECGHVYCNRASREQNKKVKTFWVSKIAE